MKYITFLSVIFVLFLSAASAVEESTVNAVFNNSEPADTRESENIFKDAVDEKSAEIKPASVLIPSSGVGTKIPVTMTPPRALKSVQSERSQPYGYNEFGYHSNDRKFGYETEENTTTNETKPFGYEKPFEKSYGYSDPSNSSVGKTGYGESGYGREGSAESYGRRTYENK
jgi:hypothetical protein